MARHASGCGLAFQDEHALNAAAFARVHRHSGRELGGERSHRRGASVAAGIREWRVRPHLRARAVIAGDGKSSKHDATHDHDVDRCKATAIGQRRGALARLGSIGP